MKTPKLPFHLLTVYEALMNNLSVTKTAKQLGVTQASISESLAKLRTIFKDELFIYDKTGLKPTALASKLLQPTHQVITDVRNLFDLRIDFDPMESERVFSIGMSSYSELLLLPPLIEDLEKTAPNTRIRIQSKDKSNSKLLENGMLDISVVISPKLHPVEFPEDFIVQKILTDDISYCVGRKNNPLFKKELTLDRYLSAHHIVSDETALGLDSDLDYEISKLNKKRRLSILTPYLGFIAFALPKTDYIGTMSAKLADLLVQYFPLKKVKAPIPTQIDIFEVWHPRNKLDPGHIWLRQKIAEIASNIYPK